MLLLDNESSSLGNKKNMHKSNNVVKRILITPEYVTLKKRVGSAHVFCSCNQKS